jgi:hypothetical protein
MKNLEIPGLENTWLFARPSFKAKATSYLVVAALALSIGETVALTDPFGSGGGAHSCSWTGNSSWASTSREGYSPVLVQVNRDNMEVRATVPGGPGGSREIDGKLEPANFWLSFLTGKDSVFVRSKGPAGYEERIEGPAISCLDQPKRGVMQVIASFLHARSG